MLTSLLSEQIRRPLWGLEEKRDPLPKSLSSHQYRNAPQLVTSIGSTADR